jgi:MATE family multidrug resistance protein
MGNEPELSPHAGRSRELLILALPLIISNSFWTIQLTIDRVMLSRLNAELVGAAIATVGFFWTPFALFQQTVSYATTFVAQYHGAGRPLRIGATIWQSLYLSLVMGIGFLIMWPLAGSLVGISGHESRLQEHETTYLRCLSFAALPMLIISATSAFFAGRGDTWPVVWINAVGTVVNIILDYAWIYGHWGFAEMGIAGAGWATVTGSWASAILGLGLIWRRQFRMAFATLSAWRPERELLRRLLYFGVPSGLQWMLDGLAFTVFILVIGNIGSIELAATSIVLTINMTALVPMLGLAQAAAVLVGQRLGMNRPDVAGMSAVRAVGWCLVYTGIAGVLFVTTPEPFIELFRDNDAERWSHVAPLIPVLLGFVAIYCTFDGTNLVLSSALRGAGDTRFVSLATLALAWGVMVVPTLVARRYGLGLKWTWIFATGYLIILTAVLVWRYRQGKWRSMRVIEAAPMVEE